jgi:hypothetical protein
LLVFGLYVLSVEWGRRGQMRTVATTMAALLAAFAMPLGYARQAADLDRLDLLSVLPTPTELG